MLLIFNNHRDLLHKILHTSCPINYSKTRGVTIAPADHTMRGPPRAPHYPPPLVPPADFSILPPATEDEILKLILDRPNQQCGLDALPTSLLKHCSCVLAPIITRIVNLSCCWWVSPSAETVSAPALVCARPKATDKKTNRFIQKCQKSLKFQQHFSRFQLTRHAPPFEVIGTNTGRSATYDFLLVIIETMGLPRTVSVIKSDDCNILPVRVFNVPPPRGSLWNFVTTVGSKN